MVPFWVALHIYFLGNQVCIQYGLITIVKCEYVLMRVEDGVGIGQSNGVTIFIPFARADIVFHQSSPLRDGNLCTELVVPYLWGHLKVAVVWVKVMAIIIKVVARGPGVKSSSGKSCSVAVGPRW